MRELANELRMWIAEKMLSHAMSIAPKTPDGEHFVRHGLTYFKNLINQSNNGE